jgi:UDP-2,3-diacylglucosamine pyrophosphatase LpxH
MGQASGRRYLIASDFHLQEVDRRPTGRLFYFDEDFARFLEHHTSASGCTLIINGDFVEFHHIPVRPDPSDELLRGVTLYPTDLKFFPGTEWQKSVWKLEVALGGHPDLLGALARFLVHGNDLHVIRGNHDLEFFWPQVQAHFRSMVVRHRPPGVSVDGMTAIAADRVEFFPWFYLEPGLVYVEHGHQYDAYCSNAHNLYPVLPRQPSRLEMTISALSMRYFGSRINVIDPVAMENVNSIPRYIWRLIKTNPDQVFAMALYYLEMTYRILRKITRPTAAADARVASHETEIREQVAKRFGVDATTLARMERLRQPPVIRDTRKSIRCTQIDLVIVGLLTTCAAIGMGATSPSPLGWLWALGELAILVALTVIGYVRLSRMNDHRNLREVARELSRLFGVRYVVLGHSHDPDAVRLDPERGTAYFNVGTWVPKREGGQFLYVEIGTERGDLARLMRWDRVRGAPLEVDWAEYHKGRLGRRPAEQKRPAAAVASGVPRA